LDGEDNIAELCRREGIVQSLNYSWSKEFLEAGNGQSGRRVQDKTPAPKQMR